MPNNGRITLCPYYRDEKNLSISCEDTFHRFRYPAQKKRHMDTYCDDAWEGCEYAARLTAMYEKMEKENMNDTDKKILELETENRSLRSELKKTAMMLGKSERRCVAKDEEIKELKQKKRTVEKLYLKYRDETMILGKKLECATKEFEAIGMIYEARFAYLIHLAGGRYSEAELEAWRKEHEYRIIPERGFDGKGNETTLAWRAEVRKSDNVK